MSTNDPSAADAAAGVAAAIYGIRNVALMGLTAARVHRAIPRALGVRGRRRSPQHRPITLHDGVQVIFVCRDVERLDVRPEALELGRALVTTPEQTALDLAARPALAASRTRRWAGRPSGTASRSSAERRCPGPAVLGALPGVADGHPSDRAALQRRADVRLRTWTAPAFVVDALESVTSLPS